MFVNNCRVYGGFVLLLARVGKFQNRWIVGGEMWHHKSGEGIRIQKGGDLTTASCTKGGGVNN